MKYFNVLAHHRRDPGSLPGYGASGLSVSTDWTLLAVFLGGKLVGDHCHYTSTSYLNKLYKKKKTIIDYKSITEVSPYVWPVSCQYSS